MPASGPDRGWLLEGLRAEGGRPCRIGGAGRRRIDRLPGPWQRARLAWWQLLWLWWLLL